MSNYEKVREIEYKACLRQELLNHVLLISMFDLIKKYIKKLHECFCIIDDIQRKNDRSLEKKFLPTSGKTERVPSDEKNHAQNCIYF